MYEIHEKTDNSHCYQVKDCSSSEIDDSIPWDIFKRSTTFSQYLITFEN